MTASSLVNEVADSWSDQTLDLLQKTWTGRFHDHPLAFFSECLSTASLPTVASPLVQGGLWEGERAILESLPQAIASHRSLYIASGHALGKDFLAGGIPLWWQATRYPAKTILTGPVARQVHEITWNELIRHVGRYRKDLPPLGGRILYDKMLWDEEHFILAFTTSTSSQHIGKAQGFHSPHICVIVTEAQAVPTFVKEQLDSLMTAGEALFIAIGNPLVTTGWFAEGLRDAANLVIHLDCEDSPNVIEGREVIPGLVSRQWVEARRKEWYEENPNHPLWWSRVKGQLPQSSIDSVFDRSLLEQAGGSCLTANDHHVVVGLDPAEFGDDESAFCKLDAGRFQAMLTTSKHEPTDTAGRAWQMLQQARGELVVVDAIGVGAGVASILRELSGDASRVLAVNVSSPPSNPESPYLNLRTELYFHAREQVQQGHVESPRDAQTIDELCETRYVVTAKGKLLLERKSDIKERLGRSPDRADAWVLAVWGLRHAKRMQFRTRNRMTRYLRERPSPTALVG